MIDQFIELFGLESIDCLLADREFVGQKWLSYVNFNRIRYHFRIRENYWVDIPRNGHRVKASWLFNGLSINQFEFHRGIVSVKGQLCYFTVTRVKNHKDNELYINV